jgi:predicted small secreted protein
MKKHIFLIAVIVAAVGLAGCNTGDVSVAGSGTAPQTVPGASNDGSGDAGIGARPGGKPAAGVLLYFEQTRTDSADNTTILGIAFQGEGGSTSSPAEIPLRTEQTLPTYPAFGHSGTEVHYLYSPRFAKDALIGVDTNTMAPRTLFGFPERVLDFAINHQGDRVAWLDNAGKVFVSTLPQGDTETLSLEKGTPPATKVQWDSAGQQLLALTAKGALLFGSKGGAWTVTWQAADATTAVLGPDGGSVAYIKADGTLHRVALGGSLKKTIPPDKPVGTLGARPINDPYWSSGALLTYWTSTAAGVNEVHAFDLDTGQDSIVARLSVPDSVGSGIVCPIALGNSIYFTDSAQGQYVIERVELGKGGGTPQLFAQPISDDEGYICPRI